MGIFFYSPSTSSMLRKRNLNFLCVISILLLNLSGVILAMNQHHVCFGNVTMALYVGGGNGEFLFFMYWGVRWEGVEKHHLREEELGLFYCWSCSVPKVLQVFKAWFFLSQGALLCEWEDAKAEPWKAHHKSWVSEQKPEPSPWHTVPTLNKLWNIEQEKRFTQKIPGKIMKVNVLPVRKICCLRQVFLFW